MKDPKKSRQRAERTIDYGVPLESAMARRERLADKYDYQFGQERVFPELVEALLEEIPDGCDLLEVGAATGLLTRPLIGRAGCLTAMEPSQGMLRRLFMTDLAEDPRLTVFYGLVEDLPKDTMYDAAVVTFTPRRGIGLMHMLRVLASHVRDRVVMMLDDDASMDWAFLARAASIQGFDTRLRVVGKACDPSAGSVESRRAVLLVARVTGWCPEIEPAEAWHLEAREIEVPFPAPRGAATRLVRYFLAGGDRALVVRTEQRGVDRLYGNLRTAVHRLGREEATVRRTDDGVQLLRLPKAEE